MKILFYINTLEHGGAERVMANLANELNKRMHRVVFITSYATDNEYYLSSEIRRLHLDSNDYEYGFLKRNFSRIKNLRMICKHENADLIISFMAEPNFRTIVATRFLAIKTIVSVRNDPNREYPNRILRFMAKLLYLFASGCIFQTDDAMNFFPMKVQNKSQIIFNPVNEKFYNTKFGEIRKDIVTVGRLEPQKNHELLIRAFSNIADKFTNENLLIYGKGSKKQKLLNLVNDLNMQDRIFLMGEHEEVHEKIKNAKLFVLSSNYEGMPNALMEAMALGIPVISTDCPCGGAKLLINRDDCGILVSVGDESEMQEAIEKLLCNPIKMNKLSKNAKNRAIDFAPEKIYDQWENFLKRL